MGVKDKNNEVEILKFLSILAVASMLLIFGCTGSANVEGTIEPSAQEEGASQQLQIEQSVNETQEQEAVAETEQIQEEKVVDESTEMGQEPIVEQEEIKKVTNPLSIMTNLEWWVTYDVHTQYATSQMTQYTKDKNFRIDVQTSGVEARTYILDSKVTTCTKYTGSWVCFESQEADATPINEQLDSQTSDTQMYEDGTRQMLGVTATCYVAKNTDDIQTRYCISPDNVPLYVKTTTPNRQGESEVIAQAYGLVVSDAEFVLPATAGSFENLIPSGYY